MHAQQVEEEKKEEVDEDEDDARMNKSQRQELIKLQKEWMTTALLALAA